VIRVLHTEWSDGWGGQEIRIINEMIAVREQGVGVYLACRNHAAIKQKAIENGIKVFVLPFRGNTDIKTMLALMKIIKEYKIDIVNTHSGKDTWVGGFAAKLAKAKFIRTRHLSNRINPSRLNFINELADFVFTTGKSVRDDMIKYNRIKPDKIISIPTGIDENVFDPKKYNKDKCRKNFGIADDEIAIGIVAVLRSFKRHDIFLKIAKKLTEEFDNLKFIIAGDGPQKEKILEIINELNIQNRVILTGYIKDVAKLLSAFDIFVLTSDSKEGVPQSIIQALLMKVPVVATDVGSIKDLFCNNNFVLINFDENKIYHSIRELILSKDKRDALSQNARSYIETNFSKTNMSSQIIEIYNKILKK